MRFRPAELEAVRAGAIDLAYRRWDRPRVLVGTRLRTAIGLIEVTSLDVVRAESITDDEARRAGSFSREQLVSWLRSRSDGQIYRLGIRHAGPDPRIALRASAELSDEDRAAIEARLERLDKASRHGAWTWHVLATIARSPAVRAPDLAAEFGLETVVFKRDVRKLKELGLTESLPVGYRLSPRGRAVLDGRPSASSAEKLRPRRGTRRNVTPHRGRSDDGP